MTSNDDPQNSGQSTAPTRARRTTPEGGSGDGAQVHDKGTTKVPADKVANAAAETLHGERAVEEKYAQPDAKALVGGATLISDPSGANPAAGERA
jgi:hypothetical protein